MALQIWLGGLGLLCFAAFTWGVAFHFRRGRKMPAGMRLTSALSVLGLIWFLWNLTQGAGPAWPFALICFAAGLAVFCWSVQSTRREPPMIAFSAGAPQTLLRHGPYRFVRHPFYLSYVLFWAGTALAVPSGAAWAEPALMGALYVLAAAREETRLARSPLGAEYRAYQRRAGMFWPVLWRRQARL